MPLYSLYLQIYFKSSSTDENAKDLRATTETNAYYDMEEANLHCT